MKQRFFLMYFLAVFLKLPLLAQQKEFIFKNFTQEEGLPSNETYCIFEDSRHYIWIATDLGVVRYNGNKFEQFQLPDNVVFKIKEDSKGRIWFFSHKAQLAYFENEKIRLFKHNDKILSRIEKIHIIDCRVDENDNILLNSYLDSNFVISPEGNIKAVSSSENGTDKYSFSIDYINKNNCFTKLNRRFNPSIYPQAVTFSITVNKGKKVTDYYVPANTPTFAHYGSTSVDGKDVYFFGGKYVLCLREDGSYFIKKMPSKILSVYIFEGQIWVGMFKNGAVMLTPNLALTNPNTVLPNKSITSITTDYEGGLWVSTLENGVYYLKNATIRRLIDKEASNPYVSRLMNLKDSALIYAKSTGLYRYSQNQNSIFFKYNDLFAVDLFTNTDNTLFLFGSAEKTIASVNLNDPQFKKLYVYDSPSEAIQVGADSIVLSTTGSIAKYRNSPFSKKSAGEGQNAALYFGKDAKNLLSKQGRLFMDSENNIWAGCNDGLYKTDQNRDTMLKFLPGSALLNNGITCIRQIEPGILSVAIRSLGIALIKDNKIIGSITEKEGLASDKVRFLLPEKKQLWAATAKGISIISFQSLEPLRYRITNIGKDDGFYNITINHLLTYQHSIVAATSNGIFFIEEPDYFITKKLPAVPFYITTVRSFSGDTSGISSISLPYSKNRLVIKYVAISFNSYETVNYLYRFNQGDTVWHSTSNSELLLENLEAGTYNLQIKAVMPNQQRYSAAQTLTITVEKPWWQNNWLRLLALLLLSAAVYAYITNRIKKIRAAEKGKTELNRKLAELEQTALRSQMNPHFIFNCLTSIQQLIVSGNKTDANEYLVKFARLIRKTLDLSGHSFISIREEQEYLNEYLFLEQWRLSGQFEYTITIHNEIGIDNVFIPNMMIQPVVENCVRHGIKSLEQKKGLIQIHFAQHRHCITCTVTDNGVGRSGQSSFNDNAFTKHKSYGVDITRKRLQAFSEFNQQHTGIEIKDLVNEDGSSAGTQVILQLPFKTSI
jgi:ligand-binding sensor domain-containing protein